VGGGEKKFQRQGIEMSFAQNNTPTTAYTLLACLQQTMALFSFDMESQHCNRSCTKCHIHPKIIVDCCFHGVNVVLTVIRRGISSGFAPARCSVS
jgi:hypothetical protein